MSNYELPSPSTALQWSVRPEAGLLHAGETLLWSGRPEPLRYATRKSIVPFAIGFVLLIFAIAGAHSAAERWDDMFFAVLDYSPILVIGAGLLLSPIWHVVRGQWTTYVLTDRRAIIDTSGILPRRTSVPLSEIDRLYVHPENSAVGDAGTVYFKEIVVPGETQTTHLIGFVAVPDIKQVEQLLRRAIGDRRRSLIL